MSQMAFNQKYSHDNVLYFGLEAENLKLYSHQLIAAHDGIMSFPPFSLQLSPSGFFREKLAWLLVCRIILDLVGSNIDPDYFPHIQLLFRQIESILRHPTIWKMP